MKRMKVIKADAYWSNTLEDTIGKNEYSVTGEFYYNKKKDRIEHIHEGKRGGEYLIIWK